MHKMTNIFILLYVDLNQGWVDHPTHHHHSLNLYGMVQTLTTSSLAFPFEWVRQSKIFQISQYKYNSKYCDVCRTAAMQLGNTPEAGLSHLVTGKAGLKASFEGCLQRWRSWILKGTDPESRRRHRTSERLKVDVRVSHIGCKCCEFVMRHFKL